ncbi:MAG: hypothetical protein K0B15_00185 [Lentimicrobium sp.]|nr:hypothetical protein [Lentimicrobium sp.]
MHSLYTFTLLLHSWNRWIILVAGILSIILAISGMIKKNNYNKLNRTTSLIFLSSLHFQLLIGLLLYFVLSPVTLQALSDFGAAMKNSTLRYWAVEHSFVNVIAIIVVQAGSLITKSRQTDQKKFKATLIWNGIALLLIIIIIPMGFMGVERPWFRF